MTTNNENNNTTLQEGDVFFADFDFDEPGKLHPAIILGSEGDHLKVCSGTSKSWHEGDESFVKINEGGTSGLYKDTYIQTEEIYDVPLESLKFKTGTLTDNQLNSINERVIRGAL